MIKISIRRVFRSVFFLSFILVTAQQANAQSWQWAAKGTCLYCALEAGAVAVDKHGNVYEAGSVTYDSTTHLTAAFGSYSITDIGFQPFQGFLVSTDQNGSYRWALGTQGSVVLFLNIAADPNGDIYVLGDCDYVFGGTFTFGSKSFTGTYFVAKVTSLGVVEWIKDVAPGAEQLIGIAVNNTGQFFTAGIFNTHTMSIGSTTLTNADAIGATPDVFVAMYDSSGAALWAKSFGGNDSENVGAIAITSTNEVYVAGAYNSPTMTVGASTLTSAGSAPYYVAKFSSAGTPLWAVTDMRDTGVFIRGLAIDKIGSLYLTGEAYCYSGFRFGSDLIPAIEPFFLAKYDSSGNPRWARSVTTDYLAGYSVVADACGNVWASGPSFNFDPSQDPMFLAEFDSAGHLLDTVSLISGGDDTPPYPPYFGQWLGIAIDNHGNLFVAGDYAVTPFPVGSTILTVPDSASELSFLLKYKYATTFCIPDTVSLAEQIVNPSGILLYPNPVTKKLNIAASGKISEVAIINLLGQTVRSTTMDPDKKVQIDVADLPAGVYFVKINGSEIRRFVKE